MKLHDKHKALDINTHADSDWQASGSNLLVVAWLTVVLDGEGPAMELQDESSRVHLNRPFACEQRRRDF